MEYPEKEPSKEPIKNLAQEPIKEKSIKEQRIRNIIHLYYSRPEIQKAIFEFSKDREISPRYFEGFGKRPDSFQYQGDVYELVKKGATSFHCSEELWKDPLSIVTGMKSSELNEIRKGWDLIIDIDSRYFDYSRTYAKIIIKFLEFHGVKHVGLKFSGSKGLHLMVPCKSFPKEINGVKTSDMFPEWPRIITNYIMTKTKDQLINEITKLSVQNKYIKDFQASTEVIPDLILVSPRHLFRMPYSLHEKTSLASVVLTKEELEDFQLMDAEPLKAKPRNFFPDSKEGEATELLIQALDWDKDTNNKEDSQNETSGARKEFAQIKLTNLSDKMFPPSIQKILEGVQDGKKRSLFILINLFRSIGMEKEELEKRIFDWNKKNENPLNDGYIRMQLAWSYRNKIVLPPNFDKDYYKGIGIIPTPEELRYKNPTNYVVRRSMQEREREMQIKPAFKPKAPSKPRKVKKEVEEN